MYLWDTNILRHFVDGRPNLQNHLQRVPRSEVALPSVVVAEALRGRCEYALKATPEQALLAHEVLLELIRSGHIIVTRNQKHFVDLLPANQLQNWIDDPPGS